MPINVGFTGKGQAVNHTALIEQIHAGAIGLKVHEDWGSYTFSIKSCIRRCR